MVLVRVLVRVLVVLPMRVLLLLLLLLRAEVRASLVLRQPVEAWPGSCCVARPSVALVHEKVHLVERGHVR